jgi:hypothetical protein
MINATRNGGAEEDASLFTLTRLFASDTHHVTSLTCDEIFGPLAHAAVMQWSFQSCGFAVYNSRTLNQDISLVENDSSKASCTRTRMVSGSSQGLA